MIKADADLILAIHHLKNNLKFPVDCRHVYGHQDGKNKKKQEKRERALVEEQDGNLYETEAESSESEEEARMMKTFQIGEKRQPKRHRKDKSGTRQDPRDNKSAYEKKLTDEAMMNIAWDDIDGDYNNGAEGRKAIFRNGNGVAICGIPGNAAYKTNMDNIEIQRGNIQSTEDGANESILRREVWMDRCSV